MPTKQKPISGAEKKTSLGKIQRKVKSYYSKMNALAELTKDQPKKNRIDKKNHFLQFYIDKEALARLNYISTLDGFDCIVAFFGIEGPSKLNKLSVCFLGANSNKEILNQHKASFINSRNKKMKAIAGDDQYPPPPYNISNSRTGRPVNCLTLENSIAEIEDFFNRPTNAASKNKFVK